jgi:predicted phosphodiesterase
MKFLILSDIHSNFEALKSVFSSVKRKHFTKIIILGDLVGYGASPNQVVNLIRSMKNTIIIRGNHDKVAAGIESGNNFNKPASISARWTYSKLTNSNRQYIANLLKGPIKINDEIAIAHGSPLNEDYYIFTEYDALEVFRNTDYKICFYGHTHYPIIFELKSNKLNIIKIHECKHTLELDKNARYLINPGSVGQPRDRHSLAAYAIFDLEKLKLNIYRIHYDISTAQQKILKAGLPTSLAARLSLGI